MRSRLLLALFTVPVLCAAIPRAASAQFRDDRGQGRAYSQRQSRDYRYRGGYDRGYRERIYIPSHRYKEPIRSRTVYRGSDYRYRDDYGYRNDYGYRSDYGYRNDYGYRDTYRNRNDSRYRDGYRYRRGTSLLDLVLRAAVGSHYRDRYSSRSRNRGRCRRGGR